MSTRIDIFRGDITKLNVDVIVDSANPTLLGGGGVDGAIHKAAGPRLLEACKKLGGCRLGEAKLTKGYRLPASFVIHTASPIFGTAGGNEEKILENCYLNSLKLAERQKFISIAFPAIATGVFGYPKELAARAAVTVVKQYLADHPETSLRQIIFVNYNDENDALYHALLDKPLA